MEDKNEDILEIEKQSTPSDSATAPSSTLAGSANLATAPITKAAARNQLNPIKYDLADSFACTYVISIIAATCAELVTYPLDLTKTRLQIQGEAAARKLSENPGSQVKYRGMFATAAGIVKEEGPLKLWQGFSPAVYRHLVYSGVRICTYDYLRRKLAENKETKLPLWKSAFCGVFAGCLAQWLASPADLVKVLMQMEGKRRLLGEPPRVHGAFHAFQTTLKKGGVKGLWKGSIPNVQRAAFVNLGDLTAYDVSKHFIMTEFNMPDSHAVHVMASFCAGFVAAALGSPADVIKARVMNQPTDEQGRGLLYKGSMDCLNQTVKKEGLAALYKGFIPFWMRLAPWALTFWVSFEHIRQMIGASGY